MNTMDIYSLKVLALTVVLILAMTIYQLLYTDYYNDVYYRALLPGSSFIDISTLDMTRSDRGIPITECIIKI
jgi:hypothetical protein